MIKLDTNPSDKQLSQFGWISLIGFPLIGFTLSTLIWGEILTTLFWVMVGVGVATCGLGRIKPSLIKPVFIGLMIVAIPIGLLVSWTLIAVIFYLMVTPVALLFKLIGRDTMNRKLDKSAESYWHVRATQPEPASYLKQY